MYYMNRETKRNIGLFLAAILVTALLEIVVSEYPFVNFGTLVYPAILECWTLTVSRRIKAPAFRRAMAGGTVSIAVLFLLRLFRYALTPYETDLERWLWYAYYLPLGALPVFFYLAGRSLYEEDPERRGKDAKGRAVRWSLLIMWGALSVMYLTNDVHRLVFDSAGGIPDSGTHSFGPGYVLGALWQITLVLLGFVIILQRCRRAPVRRLAWVPMMPVCAAILLLLIYLAAGSAPKLFGMKLYNFQELYLLGWMGFWESCIQIGLMPSNSGYGEIFTGSALRAEIVDTEGRVVYRSSERDREGSGLVYRSAPVHGGEVRWTEDHRVMDRMNAELAEAASQIEEENELIAEENRILEDKARYETKNRLFNEIAYRIHRQLSEMELLLENPGEKEFRENLPRCLCLGAYVKQRGNLTILAEENRGQLRAGDIALAMRESMEYLRLAGAECALSVENDRSLPAEHAFRFYDLFEELTEAVFPALKSMLVSFDLRSSEQMTVLLEGTEALPGLLRNSRPEVPGQEGVLTVTGEGAECFVRLSFPGKGGTEE